MANAFSGSRQQLYSPYSQIGIDPFGYSPGGTFMGGYGGLGGYGGYGGYGSYGMGGLGGYGMGRSMYGMQDLYGGMSGYNNPFVPGFGSGIGGYGGGYPTSFGGGYGGFGGSMGYPFPVQPLPSVNDLFGQYMMNQYYGGSAFNPYTLPPPPKTMQPQVGPDTAPPIYDDQGRPMLSPSPEPSPNQGIGVGAQSPSPSLDLMNFPTISQQQLRDLTQSLGNLRF